MVSDHDDEVIRAMHEYIALEAEYVRRYVNSEPLPSNKDIKPIPYKELLEFTTKVIAAEQRFKELRKLHWHY